MSPLGSQLTHLKDATDYLERLLVVEASDNDWRNDKMLEEYTGLVVVRSMLQIVQSDCELLHRRH